MLECGQLVRILQHCTCLGMHLVHLLLLLTYYLVHLLLLLTYCQQQVSSNSGIRPVSNCYQRRSIILQHCTCRRHVNHAVRAYVHGERARVRAAEGALTTDLIVMQIILFKHLRVLAAALMKFLSEILKRSVPQYISYVKSLERGPFFFFKLKFFFFKN